MSFLPPDLGVSSGSGSFFLVMIVLLEEWTAITIIALVLGAVPVTVVVDLPAPDIGGVVYGYEDRINVEFDNGIGMKGGNSIAATFSDLQ